MPIEPAKNRAFLLTAPGAAAIAVVRAVGPLVEQFLREHFSKTASPSRCVHGELRDGERVIDDPVVVLHESRNVVDINLHGGSWVVQSCIDLLRRRGFEIVEDTSDPDATDGSTLLEREMLAQLPRAATEESLRALLAQPVAWREFIDGKPSADAIRAVLEDRALWWLLNPPRVAIIGAANVGKSTLANSLFGQDRSITADLPGTTRDWVGHLANINGMPIMLLDTPGVRESSDAIEQAAIARARTEIESADLLICVLDVSQPLEPQAALIGHHPDALWLANKSDLNAAWPTEEVADAFISARTGQGIEELRDWIASRFDWAGHDLEKPRWWTQRQREMLQDAIRDPVRLSSLIGGAPHQAGPSGPGIGGRTRP